MSEYPVMPWVCPNRNFTPPMGQKTPERGSMLADKFRESGPDFACYVSLDSSPSIVYHFLMRL
jgi:hypothetical protein